MEDQQKLDANQCPVCGCAIATSGDPKKARHAMRMHLARRAVRDVAHDIWVTQQYRKFFRVGGSKPRTYTCTPEDLQQIIQRHCGEQMAQHLVV